jgi:hypothetical protein
MPSLAAQALKSRFSIATAMRSGTRSGAQAKVGTPSAAKACALSWSKAGARERLPVSEVEVREGLYGPLLLVDRSSVVSLQAGAAAADYERGLSTTERDGGMRIAIYIVFTAGAALVSGFIGLAIANRVPQPGGTLVELAALWLGGWYGFHNARKRYATRAHETA